MSQRGEAEARRLEAAIERLERAAQGWAESQLYVSPAPGEWTAMETLAHLVEIQPYWARQAQRVIQQPGGPFGRTMEDPDRLAFIAQHVRARLDDILPPTPATAEAAAFLRGLEDEDWDKVGVHARRGEMSVAMIVEAFLVRHVEEHVDQALEAAEAARAG